jgi:hypothetical protein
VRDVQPLGQPFCLSSLARSGRANQDESHVRHFSFRDNVTGYGPLDDARSFGRPHRRNARSLAHTPDSPADGRRAGGCVVA